MKIDQDSPQVYFPPPLMLFLCLIIGAGLQKIFPVEISKDPWRWWVAGALSSLGLGIILYCAYSFKKAQTDIRPWKSTTSLVISEIYNYTRNPIYLSFMLIGIGGAFAVNSAWVFVLLLPLAIIYDRWVIQKEERYLESKFGQEFRADKSKVRRWI